MKWIICNIFSNTQNSVIYHAKVYFDPLSPENNIIHTHQLLKAEKRGSAYFDYFETFIWMLFIWFACSLAFYYLKMFNLCSIHSKDRQFKQRETLSRLKVTSKVQRSNMMKSFGNIINFHLRHIYLHLNLSKIQGCIFNSLIYFINGVIYLFCQILFTFDLYNFFLETVRCCKICLNNLQVLCLLKITS